MPNIESLIAFAVALFFLELSPGPDMMLVIGRGIGQGRRIALLTVVGSVFVSGSAQVALLVLGLASLLQAHPLALEVLRWTGAAYLLWYGLRLLVSSHSVKNQDSSVSTNSNWAAVRDGAINNFTNPKSFLFMFAFLPQFVDPSAGPIWMQLLILGSLQKLSGIFSLGSVALASGMAGKWLQKWPRMLAWQNRFTGLIMISLAMRLVVSESAAVTSAHRIK